MGHWQATVNPKYDYLLILDFGYQFPFFPKNLKGTTLDFVQIFQENRVSLGKIIFLTNPMKSDIVV